MPNQAFHERLVAAMDARAVSVPRLAELCGGAFKARTITRWRGGHTVPGAEALPIIGEALGVPAGWLVGEGDDEVPEVARV